ncbi:MAG TPA: cytochrome P450 [Pseudonocardia sp.]|nr:cytochrome P450 [Pseudonocardia sp.]
MSTGAPETNIDFDHTDPDFFQSPYQTFQDLHTTCPVARSSKFGGFWVLSKYNDVVEAARDTTTFSSAEGISIPKVGSLIPLVPIEADPPLHTEFRRTLQHEFSRGRMEKLEPSIRKLTNELIDGFIDRGHADLAVELATPLPSIVLAELLGLPREDWNTFRGHVSALVATSKVGDAEANMETSVAFAMHFMQVLEDRRNNPRDDMLTRIAASTVSGRTVAPEEALGLTLVTVIAGHETTVGGIGSMLMHVGSSPPARERLLADPSLIPRAVEETIRMEAPIQGAARTVTRPACVGGQEFSPGERVWLLYAAGNRDAGTFAEPDTFDLDRKPNRHLGFGEGVHRCVGAPLAQIEMRIVLEEVLRRMPKLRLPDPSAVRFEGAQSRTVGCLPMEWT